MISFITSRDEALRAQCCADLLQKFQHSDACLGAMGAGHCTDQAVSYV
jgi:hypothetical protein